MTIIGIVTKPRLRQTSSVLEELLDWLRRKQKTVLVGSSSVQDGRTGQHHLDARIAAEAEFVIVLGGDGTMLQAARLVEERSVPILGINLGGLGFLTESTVDTMYDSLDKVFAQDFHLDHRLRLQASIRHDNGQQRRETALNDVVIGKGDLGLMISTKIHVDQKFVTNLRGDGLIIASPTGSTGYSMAAGGPILNPELETVLLTPISPHTFTHRPLLVPGRSSLEIQLTSNEGGTVRFDGQIGVSVGTTDTITVSASPHRTSLVRFPDRTYYEILRNKLKWGDV
ncbi:MAG: NAD(+)/NADH kinase [Nitrospira sp.]|nr:NAD(+)/NADH kinase [Nitrospira sp.]